MSKKSYLLLYIPVFHAGYLKLFEECRKRVDGLYILGDRFIKEFTTLHQEIAALNPSHIKIIIENLGLFKRVSVLTKQSLDELHSATLISADEDISRRFVETYLPHEKVTYKNIFLRWEERSVAAHTPLSVPISTNAFDRRIMRRAIREADKSSDWWRHVGAVIVRDGKVILEGHNHHVPSEHMPYVFGDPRDYIEAGILSHFSSALHAEQDIIVKAARDGVTLKGTSIYVNVFPCPLCAKLVAYSGIKKCFFASGSASLDGGNILNTNGVELVRVQ